MTPEKTASITFTATDLGDKQLPIATISKTDLQTFLNGVNGDVAFYFASVGDASNGMKLILAEETQSGVSGTNHLESVVLPCPPYCK
ncbi:MAG: hypothetical protein AAFZ15_21620 [Bacteroidota bacterium]